MKFLFSIYLLIIFSTVISAQADSSSNKKEKSNIEKESNKDTAENNLHKQFISPRTLIIKIKDLTRIDSLTRNQFIVIDKPANYTVDELASGLSENELDAYRKNKGEINNLLTLPLGEEETYPLISKLRKILGDAQSIGAIIILLLFL